MFICNYSEALVSEIWYVNMCYPCIILFFGSKFDFHQGPMNRGVLYLPTELDINPNSMSAFTLRIKFLRANHH